MGEHLVKQNWKRRAEIGERTQQDLVERALKGAEESNKPSKKGRFGKDELATNDEDQFDADEANANQPVEPNLKKHKEDTQQGSADVSKAPLKIVNENKMPICET